MAEEISTKTSSLMHQLNQHFYSVWLPLRFENVRIANVPDSFPPSTLHSFLEVASADFVFNLFDPPFPIHRNQNVYSADHLDSVIFSLFLEQSHGSIEILEETIAAQVVENALSHLRSGIMTSACKNQPFLDEFFASRKTRIDRALSFGIEKSVVDSLIRQSCRLIIRETSIYKAPPFPIDRSSSYSDETVQDLILPILRREMFSSRKTKAELTRLKSLIDADAYHAAVRQFRTRVGELMKRYRMNYSFLDTFPQYLKIINGRKRSFDERAFQLLNDETSYGSSYILISSVRCDRG
jgi:hypothetical protein